jgi:poly-gamma-glutamate synthesis protein (capsule biosynthesis protein)
MISHRRIRGAVIAVAAALAMPALVGRGQNLPSGQVPVEPQGRARDRAVELAMKVPGRFTLAAVGDVMARRPLSTWADPGFQGALAILRDADVAMGNLEGNLADLPRFEGPLRGMMGSRDVARDLKAMGFDMVNRANNHVFDSDKEGMLSTIDLLDEAGVVHAGTGRNLDFARAPAYLETPKGRIALVGMHTPHNTANANATRQEGNIGGRPGLNPLNYTIYHHVTREQFDAIKSIRRAVYTPPPGTTNAVKLRDPDPADEVELFGVWYAIGTPGTKSFRMNQSDLQEILRSIRNGKYLSNVLVATIHAHQGPITAQQWLYEDQTPDFLVELAHLAIDNGADAFVGHGPHVLRGIEIYKGKPVFYGLGEFLYQWQQMDASLLTGSWQGRGRGGQAGDEITDVELAASSSWRPVNFESLIALSRYQDGRLVEVRLYPADGGFDGPVATLGIPRLAAPDVATKILQRVQALSKPFGTTIGIENGVGVIRP